MLALGQGAVMFHGALIRHLTSGQLPIHMLVSEDNGKAQVDKVIFCWIYCHCLFRASLTLPRGLCSLHQPRTTSSVLTRTSGLSWRLFSAIILNLVWSICSQVISRTSLPCLLEDIRNPLWLNKLLESRYRPSKIKFSCFLVSCFKYLLQENVQNIP